MDAAELDDAYLQKTVLAFIEGRFPDMKLAATDDIFALGFVTSLFAMELVLFLESTFGFTIPNDALRLDNFRTAAGMAALVREHGAP